jgi:P-type Ca2+ transporter type 2C
MSKPPRRLSDRIVDRVMQLGVLFVGAVMALATLLTIDVKLPDELFKGSSSLDEARTAGFTVLVLTQLFNCFNARSERGTAFRGLFANPLLGAAIALCVFPQVLVVHVGVLNDAFSTAPISGGDWLMCTAIASTVLWAVELKKLVIRRTAR